MHVVLAPENLLRPTRVHDFMTEATRMWSHASSEQLLLPQARQIARIMAIVACSLVALLEAAITVPLRPIAQRRVTRARWLHRWCRVAARILRLKLLAGGPLPSCGLLVSNHLSYLDVIAFSALRPCVFVAKSEVARWPVFGWLARAAGTIFVDRSRRTAAAQSVTEIGYALRENVVVVLFPEGTSSDARSVLPFKSALLESIVQLDCPLSAAFISYSLDRGSVADEVCYWRDMTFLPHLWNLCGKQSLAARLAFSSVPKTIRTRKEMAIELHQKVELLRCQQQTPCASANFATALGA